MALLHEQLSFKKSGRASQVVLLFVVLLTLTELATTAQVAPYPARYSPAQILGDFEIFEKAVREMHAGLFVHRSPEEIDAAFAEGRSSLADATSERELHLALLRVIHQIGDGHMGARTSEASIEFFDRQPAYMPFKLVHLAGGSYVHHDYGSEHGGLEGAQVLSVGGRPVGELLSAMMLHTPGDGRSVTGRRHRLNDTVTFGRLYQRLFGPAHQFTVELVRQGSSTPETLQFSGITGPQLDLRFEERYPEDYSGRSRWELSFPDSPAKTAVLRLSIFAGSKLPAFLDDTFAQLRDRSIQNLVLDLRRNGGGLEIHAQRLVAHLVTRPFDFYDRAEVTARRFEYGRYSANNPSVFDETEAVPGPSGRLLLTPERRSFLTEHPPLEPHFGGRLIVLVDGGTFSTAADVVTALHRHTEATFVGEEVGGGYYGNTSGSTKTLYLPVTKTRVRIPIEHYVSAQEGAVPRSRGLTPDTLVPRTIEELLGGSDRALERAFELLNAPTD